MNITAVAIFAKNGKVLMERRGLKEDNYAGFWALPGGHKRKKEKIERTLIREMEEELKIKITDFRYIGKFRDIDPTSGKPYYHNSFLCLEWKGRIKKKKLKWFRIRSVIEGGKQFRKADKSMLKKLENLR